MMKAGWMSWALGAALSAVLAAGLSPFAARRAQAATVLALDLKGLVTRADVIALGRARSSSARWATYGKVIVTDVEFAVQRPLKGKVGAGESIVITRLGGELEDIGLSVPGAATFELGKTALVFLRRAGEDLRVVGMAQGVMPVTGEGANATVQTTTDAVERVEVDATGTTHKAAAPANQAVRRPLSEVLAEIATLVGSGS